MVHCLGGFSCGRYLRRFWTRGNDSAASRASDWNVRDRQTEPANSATHRTTHSATSTPTVAPSGSRIELEVLYFSGAMVTVLDAHPSWSGAELKRVLRPFLEKGVAIMAIVSGGTRVEETQTLAEAGVQSGPLYVMLRSCTYLVQDAGVEVVNGYYVQKEGDHSRSPVYANEDGILLFKYRMARGTEYWYFSREGDLSRSDGDFYRVRSNQSRPPVEGWTWEACPLGRRTNIPTLTYFGGADEDLQDCSSSTASGEAHSFSDTSD
ncbi:Cbp20-A [Symbiodinium natans]|uniref:Cbp20-A protein n=1 Tax=Symbiodinium natans TaxID=878477 RepID=A0A812P9Y3_9DINO|nr:Cbp20-A [Symbiodinium natans]